MLDPTRLKLGAESVGYLARFGLPIEWVQFDKALQTDYNNQGSAVQVRREKEDQDKNMQIHVMGGQLAGKESNSLLLTQDRQQRQINGYPLRQFSAENPAVVLPKKYGGLPRYTRSQTEVDQYVSRFTEPLSAQLDSHTTLLSKGGLPALTEDVDHPYDVPKFINPMTTTRDELLQNHNVFRQRMHLQKMSNKARRAKRDYANLAGYNMFYDATKQNILVDSRGNPTSFTADDLASRNDTNTLLSGVPSTYARRQAANLQHQSLTPSVVSDMSSISQSSSIRSIGESLGYIPSPLHQADFSSLRNIMKGGASSHSASIRSAMDSNTSEQYQIVSFNEIDVDESSIAERSINNRVGSIGAFAMAVGTPDHSIISSSGIGITYNSPESQQTSMSGRRSISPESLKEVTELGQGRSQRARKPVQKFSPSPIKKSKKG